MRGLWLGLVKTARFAWLRAIGVVALVAAVWVGLAGSTARAEVGEPAGWNPSLATHHIVVGRAVLRYEPHLEPQARALAEQLPRWWNAVETSMATDLDDTVEIWFMDHAGRISEATGMPRWVAGVAHSASGEIMIARHGPSGAPTPLEALLKHELAHVAVHRATGGASVPRWFHEGVAEAAEGGVSLSRAQTLAGTVFGPGVPDFDDLDAQFHAEGPQVAAAYAAARDFVIFLRDIPTQPTPLRDRGPAGRNNLKQLMTELKAGHTFEAALVRVYGRGLGELGLQWRQGLRGRFIWYPLLAGGTLPLALAGPLVVLAWVRRRRDYRAGMARLDAAW